MELSKNIKTEIVKQKIEAYQQQYYSLDLDVKVAKAVADDKMLDGVKTRLKTVIAAIEILNAELEQLTK